MINNIEYKLEYNLNDDLTELNVILTSLTVHHLYKKLICYDLILYDERATLYNKILEDFGAEYNNVLAQLFDDMLEQMIKEGEYNEV